jgi:uncharacterized protein DUF6529
MCRPSYAATESNGSSVIRTLVSSCVSPRDHRMLDLDGAPFQRRFGLSLRPLGTLARGAIPARRARSAHRWTDGALASDSARGPPLHLKVWFASVAVALALAQLVTAAWIFRKLPWPRPPWIPVLHRWVGRLALLCTIPVAYHCIFRLGFQTADTRVLAHSLFGCAVYGAFAAKVTIVRLHRFPRWVLPSAGGLLFAVLVGVWYSSALWFFRTIGVGI